MRLSGSETVLAVDDDPGMLDLLGEILRPVGYTFIATTSGEEALQVAAAQQDKIDLLLTDVVLPGINGHELAKRLMMTCPDVNVLFMSGYLCPSMAHSVADKRIEAFIQKPFAPRTLLRKIRKLLA